MPRNNNQKVVPQAANALDQFKLEIATELGIPNYNQIDKGDLPSRMNGYVGGNMTKRLVAAGEQFLAQQGTAAMPRLPLETPQ